MTNHNRPLALLSIITPKALAGSYDHPIRTAT